MSSFAANDFEFDGVVYFCANVRDLVLSEIGSFRVWIDWMFGELSESMLDWVCLAIGSWSPLELISTCVFLVIVSNFCCTTPLEFTAVCFYWPSLEVVVGCRTDTTTCLGMIGVECGNAVCALGGKDSSVCQFGKIVQNDSIAANCESHMIVGTSLSAVDKKCMAWVILSSSVTWGCMKYSCKYPSVSVIINALFLLSIAWIQR